MSNSQPKSGGSFLTRKSLVTKARRDLHPFSSVLVVEDEKPDADRLEAILNLMFGYNLRVHQATTLSAAMDIVLREKLDLVFLDDVLKPSDTASDSIPYLRGIGFEGPIVVISSKATRKRKAELFKTGANDVIHKDDVDSVRIAEALAHVFAQASKDSQESAAKDE